MKRSTQKRFSFLVRAMAWSVLFYIVLMLAFNWEDVRNKMNGKGTVTVIDGTIPAASNEPSVSSIVALPQNIPSGIIHDMLILVKGISSVLVR